MKTTDGFRNRRGQAPMAQHSARLLQTSVVIAQSAVFMRVVMHLVVVVASLGACGNAAEEDEWILSEIDKQVAALPLTEIEVTSSDPAALERAKAACEGGDYEATAKICRQILSGNPDAPTKGEAQFHLGRACRALGLHEAAVGAFEAVLSTEFDDHEPDSDRLNLNRYFHHESCVELAKIYEELGDKKKAIEYVMQARDRHRYVYWCGTCAQGQRARLNAYIRKLGGPPAPEELAAMNRSLSSGMLVLVGAGAVSVLGVTLSLVWFRGTKNLQRQRELKRQKTYLRRTET